ncbi:3-dehydroquinate synthase [Sporanaerobium hydrogeniformans]|uniref:3-dehydroquinate synthase n=1 Tax=Sporanaerobium hydrogeniformans TaxID=3072179 RepID=A0AC61DEV9_9FIRM|nr:3-dehydroquinate synthase [Sporanaerobium hydrogeniformans]PHV71137.1 3-dehydroquinate synthase [Sporanaerobium hydrogeniformans]
MKQLKETLNRPYKICIAQDFNGLCSYISQVVKPSKICIITDSHVAPFYLEVVARELMPLAPVISTIFEAGEAYKNSQTVAKLYESLIEHGLDRSSLIIALGGGVVGDMAGFVAATYMRGIGFVQVPTTVLAQNDSSIGGKVGIDFMSYKNMVGAFYNPLLVYSNVGTLHSLPKREIIGGLAEAIKHGLIANEALFYLIKDKREALLKGELAILEEMTEISCKVKCEVVEADQKEQGLRRILNFGHTLGHAIETLSHFNYSHGESVAYGMAMAAFISFKRGYLQKEALKEIISVCQSFGLLEPIQSFEAQAVWENMSHDKKKQHGQIAFILLRRIGETVIVKDVSFEEVEAALQFIEETCQ